MIFNRKKTEEIKEADILSRGTNLRKRSAASNSERGFNVYSCDKKVNRTVKMTQVSDVVRDLESGT